MAKLHFFYSTMNAGKSTSLLQSNHNYLENNLETLLFLPKENISFNEGKIVSRIGIDVKQLRLIQSLIFMIMLILLSIRI